jgi:Family of unknown function (DUF6112)
MKCIEMKPNGPYAEAMLIPFPSSLHLLASLPLSLAARLATAAAPAGTSLSAKAAGAVSARLVDTWTMHPDPSALPGGQVLQNLMNGLQSWALAFALIGLVIGAAAWALGSHGQNYQQSFVGRRAVLISGFAALLIGAGPGIVSFFFNAGQGVH